MALAVELMLGGATLLHEHDTRTQTTHVSKRVTHQMTFGFKSRTAHFGNFHTEQTELCSRSHNSCFCTNVRSKMLLESNYQGRANQLTLP